MTGYTAAEKIFSRHSGGRMARAGEIVVASPTRIMLHEITGALTFEALRNMGAKRLAYSDRVMLVGDHYSPPPSPDAAKLLSDMTRFGRDMDVPHIFVSGEGIEHTLLPERGLLRPGDLVIGTDSHTCTAGAFGALGTGMGSTDVAAAMALGELWFSVPETIRVTYQGVRRPFVTAKDMILALLGLMTVDGATYRCVEFAGEAMASLNIDERMALCNMTVEGGAKTCFVPPDETLSRWVCDVHGSEAGVDYVYSDKDATFASEIAIDLGEIGPQCARPYSPDNVAAVDGMPATRIDQAYIGNCANGTMTDLRQAAEILRGRKVAPHVRCIVVPATQRIFAQAAREGLLEVFAEAGAIVGPSTCGACAGLHFGVLTDGQTAVATTNRNYRGRMGSPGSSVYLANAWTATQPRSELSRRERLRPPCSRVRRQHRHRRHHRRPLSHHDQPGSARPTLHGGSRPEVHGACHTRRYPRRRTELRLRIVARTCGDRSTRGRDRNGRRAELRPHLLPQRDQPGVPAGYLPAGSRPGARWRRDRSRSGGRPVAAARTGVSDPAATAVPARNHADGRPRALRLASPARPRCASVGHGRQRRSGRQRLTQLGTASASLSSKRSSWSRSRALRHSTSHFSRSQSIGKNWSWSARPVSVRYNTCRR